ncbi:Armadillo-type fold-containing protein [Dioscorea alata]|uniref:Armadillo-type fold-containing protein n=1 Tax=Dioscorea alata TaxID=55571 RepID=A0ACB7WV48_DIOAL|nr:Armadillo-type fold-containing protein [Dioscorea alata]
MAGVPTPTPTPFLEDLLRSSSSSSSSPSSPSPSPAPPSAHSILQAWSELRHPSSSSTLLSSLLTLSSVPRPSLHLSDPQAKILLSLLSSSPPSSPSTPLLLSLLSIWPRKSPRPSSSLLLSALPLIPSSLSPQSLLFLGSLSLHASSRTEALSLLSRLLDSPVAAPPPDLLPDFLAGLGYALSRSDPSFFKKGFTFLLRLWSFSPGSSFSPSLSNGLMVLKLLEWLVAGFLNSRSFHMVQILCNEVSPEMCRERMESGGFRFAVVMACAGVLRAFRMVGSSSKLGINLQMRSSVEGSIALVAKSLVLGSSDSEKHLLLQCLAIGLARCGPISFNADVFQCLCIALLDVIFPIMYLCRRALEVQDGNSEVKQHLESILFKEAGGITGVFCNQYALADEKSRVLIESDMWRYTQEVYLNLRLAVFVLRGMKDELLGDLEKIAEAAFLMVVVFAAEVTKRKLNAKASCESRSEVSVHVLVSFSCVEYLRRVRLSEYTDAIRQAVLTIQENASTCASFVGSMPSYIDLTEQQGLPHLEGKRYVWCNDEVQTARILFYLRVMPTCIGLVPGSLFAKVAAPTVFLYMQHPNGKVARAAHAVFVAFISSGNDSEQDDRSALKEQLTFYYIQRALEAFPGVTPFEGLASGIAALVRYLPAGSPALFYCVHSLVEKTHDLCAKATSRDANIWKNWEKDSEPFKKVTELLLRLISLVDIQVLLLIPFYSSTFYAN